MAKLALVVALVLTCCTHPYHALRRAGREQRTATNQSRAADSEQGDSEQGNVPRLPDEPRPRPHLQQAVGISGWGGNGHSSTHDGRLFITRGDGAKVWGLRLFRPEELTYDSDGSPNLGKGFSGKAHELVTSVCGGENSVAFCFPDRTKLWSWSGSNIVYEPYLFDMEMGPTRGKLRRRKVRIEVANPFTRDAKIVKSATTEGCRNVDEKMYSELKTTSRPIEGTISADGKLMFLNGGKLLYSYTSQPCSLNWNPMRPIHKMRSDPAISKERYAIARDIMRFADGTTVTDGSQGVLGAYPWVDHDGRNLFYTSVRCKTSTCSNRREGYSLIGADTRGKHYLIDGQPNGVASRAGAKAILFHSGPMWNFERERLPKQMLSPGTTNVDNYLPATPSHEVQPLFGSNSRSYAEVNIVDVWKAQFFDAIFLPFNELVSTEGAFDLGESPDVSGNAHTASMSSGRVTTHSSNTGAQPGGVHSMGRALQVNGGIGATASLQKGPGVGSAAPGLTIQGSFKMDSARSASLLKHSDFEVSVRSDRSVSFRILGQTVTSPAVTAGAWHHFAGRVCAVTKKLALFVDGKRVAEKGVSTSGTVQLSKGTLTIGNDFMGLIDEVRIVAHARHHRNICKTAFGSGCMPHVDYSNDLADLKMTPAMQNPKCTGNVYSAMPWECANALHNICALEGARALEKREGTTARKAIFGHFDVKAPMFGMFKGASQIVCGPTDHVSRAAEWYELEQHNGGCKGELNAASSSCHHAYNQWCDSMVGNGFRNGVLFHVTARPWITCFKASGVSSSCGSNGAVPLGDGQFACFQPSFVLNL